MRRSDETHWTRPSWRWFAVGFASAGLSLALLFARNQMREVIGPFWLDVVFAITPATIGVLVAITAGGTLSFALSWAIPLTVVNGLAVLVLPNPYGIVLNWAVLVSVLVMLLSQRAMRWWWALLRSISLAFPLPRGRQ